MKADAEWNLRPLPGQSGQLRRVVAVISGRLAFRRGGGML